MSIGTLRAVDETKNLYRMNPELVGFIVGAKLIRPQSSYECRFQQSVRVQQGPGVRQVEAPHAGGGGGQEEEGGRARHVGRHRCQDCRDGLLSGLRSSLSCKEANQTLSCKEELKSEQLLAVTSAMCMLSDGFETAHTERSHLQIGANLQMGAQLLFATAIKTVLHSKQLDLIFHIIDVIRLSSYLIYLCIRTLF